MKRRPCWAPELWLRHISDVLSGWRIWGCGAVESGGGRASRESVLQLGDEATLGVHQGQGCFHIALAKGSRMGSRASDTGRKHLRNFLGSRASVSTSSWHVAARGEALEPAITTTIIHLFSRIFSPFHPSSFLKCNRLAQGRKPTSTTVCPSGTSRHSRPMLASAMGAGHGALAGFRRHGPQCLLRYRFVHNPLS